MGTDYPTYLSLFKNIDSAKNEDTEFGFVYFVYLCNYLGFYGQDLFFIIAFFWILSLLQISRTITTSKYVFIFVFVFVTVSTVFNNQMNGVRQYVAVYFFTSSVLYMLNKKYVLFLIAFFLSFSWHMSAVILVPILLLFYFFKLQHFSKTFHIFYSKLNYQKQIVLAFFLNIALLLLLLLLQFHLLYLNHLYLQPIYVEMI